ncbi:DUF3093 domain-containing protein [Allostreptomyces psammosilenae]|uniref:DUF3093 domain-containing protein n=1 Tax=Allostreptomyces psammosilenae TaxID=1892865 RepID=A0A852ZXY5_9ACTN|nr:DUF3093 domain-containing protein [Allostreptomyces psammosilenae]NYI03142.1 hypothetical protein [Allostreptomyces psammosilenae]
MYDERLTVPASWWALILLPGVSLALVLLLFGPVPALIGFAAGCVGTAIALTSYGGARIRVVRDLLVAGDARIPVTALGTPEPLTDPEEARAWRMHRADPRAFMLLRSYVPTACRVPVEDPADPTPYLYLSTRNPRRLAESLVRAQEAARSGTAGPAD